MSDDKEAAKAAKKVAKARVKALKKAAGRQSGVPTATPGAPRAGSESEGVGPTPAERSAAAAERQARLHAIRVWVSLIMLLLAIATFLLTAKPWRWFDRASGATRQAPVESAPQARSPTFGAPPIAEVLHE